MLRQFRGRPKEFSAEALREVGMRMCEISEVNPELPDLTWAKAGLDDPLVLGRALLGCEFLKFKSGRSSSAASATEEDILLLESSNWYAIHPMYHAGLGVEGFIAM